MDTKEQYRDETLKKRFSLNDDQVMSGSKAISKTLITLLSKKNITHIAGYIPIKNEVDLADVYTNILDQKKSLYFPKFNTETKGYDLHQVSDLSQLKKGKYDILEPNDDTRRLERPEKRIDFWAVPGIAFDKKGNRIGWGKGFYDSLLTQSEGVKCGICYDVQAYDQLPYEEHDILMDLLVTESGINEFK